MKESRSIKEEKKIPTLVRCRSHDALRLGVPEGSERGGGRGIKVYLAAPLVSLDLLMPGSLSSLTHRAGVGGGQLGGFRQTFVFPGGRLCRTTTFNLYQQDAASSEIRAAEGVRVALSRSSFGFVHPTSRQTCASEVFFLSPACGRRQ